MLIVMSYRLRLSFTQPGVCEYQSAIYTAFRDCNFPSSPDDYMGPSVAQVFLIENAGP